MAGRKSIFTNQPTSTKDEQEEMITIGTIMSPMEPINVKQRFSGEIWIDKNGRRDVNADLDRSVRVEGEKSWHYKHTPKPSREEEWSFEDKNYDNY